ncbi:hypothetical protein C8F04DRAFT_1397685 [Mycena alexandri]|uniref:Uncharacterized protein n=1 Tax=Mycena alexandri TaxID=1745969 RepID=A0AAD6SPF0_9AGAR|nr:hypothetical protein C8F04DRAFT_1397685 [Mycena alexandri]
MTGRAPSYTTLLGFRWALRLSSTPRLHAAFSGSSGVEGYESPAGRIWILMRPNPPRAVLLSGGSALHYHHQRRLFQSPPSATSATPQHKHRDTAHEGTSRAQAQPYEDYFALKHHYLHRYQFFLGGSARPHTATEVGCSVVPAWHDPYSTSTNQFLPQPH